MNKEVDELLSRMYFDPSLPSSFGGIQRLQESAKLNKRQLDKTEIVKFLKEQDAYTIHRDIKRRFKRQSIIAPSIDYQWQADLVILNNLRQYNDGFNNILMCIDVFSRYAWAVPLKTKTGQEIIRAFTHIFDTSGRKPIKLNTDQGTEFVNSEFQTFLKARNIDFFVSVGDTKAAICERLNRTIKSKMWRYFTWKNTYRYIDVLPSLMEAYNNSKHRTIGIAPAKVNSSNSNKIRLRLKRMETKVGNKKPKYFVNQPVRLSSLKSPFAKGYTGNWTDEIFFVDKIYFQYLPFMYRIRDENGFVIKGRFYEQELQGIVIAPDKEYKIERIVAKRTRGGKNQVLIKWLGYPDSANTWEPEENIRSL